MASGSTARLVGSQSVRSICTDFVEILFYAVVKIAPFVI